MKTTEQKHKDPSTAAIIQRANNWWTGIKEGRIQFIPGLPLIAEYIPAFVPGHTLLLTGYTSAGKSQFLSQIISWTAGEHGQETAVFSLEDSAEEKLFSIAAAELGDVHKRRMILGDMDDHMRWRIDEKLSEISFWPLNIYDDIRTLGEIKEIIKQTKPKIVILDYIQKLRIPGGSIYDRMAVAADETYWMAREPGQEFTFIIASQIDGKSAREESGVFIASKGAGDLVEAAHSVIQISKGRKDHLLHEVYLNIKKNKAFGPVGEIACQFNHPHWTRIIERTEHVG